jgi:hypothetical protein
MIEQKGFGHGPSRVVCDVKGCDSAAILDDDGFTLERGWVRQEVRGGLLGDHFKDTCPKCLDDRLGPPAEDILKSYPL